MHKYLTAMFMVLLTVAMFSACTLIRPTQTTATKSTILTSNPTTVGPTETYHQTMTPIASATVEAVRSPIVQSPSLTPSLTLPATLEPGEAKQVIEELLREPIDCKAPCVWGIVPGKTTLDQAKATFTHLGLEVKSTTLNNKDFYGTAYKTQSGLSFGLVVTVVEDVVVSIEVLITPEEQKPNVAREWQTYSPETMIKRYGSPSNVEFKVGYPRDPGPGPQAWYHMSLYFDSLDLIVEYQYGEINPPIASLGVCPLKNQFEGVRIWSGKNPESPPLEGIPLKKATSMTLNEFSELMTGDPEGACFTLKKEFFH